MGLFHLFCTCAILGFGLTAVIAESPSSAVVNVSLVKKARRYVGHIHVDGLKRNLNLKRAGSLVLGSDFKFTVADVEPWNESTIKDITPSPRILSRLQRSIYVDSASGAAFKVEHRGKTDIRLHGLMDGVHISHDGLNHVAERIHKRDVSSIGETSRNEHADKTRLNKAEPSARNVTCVSPKVLIVVDHLHWLSLGQNCIDVIEHVSMLMSLVNLWFGTSEDPKIKFRIVGIHVLGDTSFMNDSRLNGSKDYDLWRVWKNFNLWLYKRTNFPKYDIAALVTRAVVKGRDSGGNYVQDFMGLALKSGACFEDHPAEMSNKGVVTEDSGALWQGAFTLAHELAHSLGAPHDGEGRAKNCSEKDGHIMSSPGWDQAHKFTFSDCSRKLMRDFINSPEGSCLWETPNPYPLRVANKDALKMLSIEKQCGEYWAGSAAYSLDLERTAPEEFCKLLSCQSLNENKFFTRHYQWPLVNSASLKGTLCGSVWRNV